MPLATRFIITFKLSKIYDPLKNSLGSLEMLIYKDSILVFCLSQAKPA